MRTHTAGLWVRILQPSYQNAINKKGNAITSRKFDSVKKLGVLSPVSALSRIEYAMQSIYGDMFSIYTLYYTNNSTVESESRKKRRRHLVRSSTLCHGIVHSCARRTSSQLYVRLSFAAGWTDEEQTEMGKSAARN